MPTSFDLLTFKSRLGPDDQYLVCFLSFASSPRTLTNPLLHRGTTFLLGPSLGPAITGYIEAASNWKTSFGALTAFYGFSTILLLLFGRETYFVKAQHPQRTSRIKAVFGIGNTNLPLAASCARWSNNCLIYIFKAPMLLVG